MFNKSIFIIILLFSISLNCSSKIEQEFDSKKVEEFQLTDQVSAVEKFYKYCEVKLETLNSDKRTSFLIHMLELICVKANALEDKNSELYKYLMTLDQEVTLMLSFIKSRFDVKDANPNSEEWPCRRLAIRNRLAKQEQWVMFFSFY